MPDAAAGEVNRPTVEECTAAARFNHPNGYNNELLIKCANLGDAGSIRELLVRHIMRIEDSEWEHADAIVKRIEDDATSGLFKHKLPYFFGVVFGFVSAWGSLPMVFDLDTALWFVSVHLLA